MSVGLCSEKFNIVSKDYGHTQKCGFCVSVGKTNFTGYHTPDTINGFRDSILVCKMHDCHCTIRKNFQHFHSFSSGLLIKQQGKGLQWVGYVKTNHFKMLLNVFNTRYTYLLLKNNLTNICSKISKIGMNLWMMI